MKIALIQQKFQENVSKTMQYTHKQIRHAAQNGAKLILLQELHQGPYFCQNEDVAHFEYADNWEEDKKFWAEVAKKNRVVLVASLFEKRAPGIYHNTAVVFEKDGTIAGMYRKMHIPQDPGYEEKFYFTPGDGEFKAINTSVGKIGVLICWDQWYPEAARLMALDGAQILVYPTAIGWFESDSTHEKQKQLDAWITIQKSHAVANGVFVASINRVGFEPDPSGVLQGINFWGNSFVCGPQGEILAQADEQIQTILYQEIDYHQSTNVRQWWPFLRDRRIECYNDLTKRYIDSIH